MVVLPSTLSQMVLKLHEAAKKRLMERTSELAEVYLQFILKAGLIDELHLAISLYSQVSDICFKKLVRL